MFKALAIGLLTQQSMLAAMNLREKRIIFQQAKDYAESLGKPLLVVGTPKISLMHGCGDVTIDIDPGITPCDVEIADVREIPYTDGYFGAAYASHIIEHLATVDDAKLALNELHRVADQVFVVSPSKMSLPAWLNPDHHLWVTASGDGFLLEQRGISEVKPDSYIIGMRVM